MAKPRKRFSIASIASMTAGLAAAIAVAVAVPAGAARAQDCSDLLGLFEQGGTDAQIARATGMRAYDVALCRQQLSQPVLTGPAGVAPRDAAGPPPLNAAGPPPFGAAGPPPLGAAGPPPLNAAGAAPVPHAIKRVK